jgi:hypothetical protein
MKNVSELEQLKIIYKQIIDGCSFFDNKFYIKHLTELEIINITEKRNEFFNKYISSGIQIESDRLIELENSEEWLKTDEEEIQSAKLFISDNEKTIQSIIPQQKIVIQKLIDDKKTELNKLIIKKRNLIGLTAEDLSQSDANQFLIYSVLYKDKNCEKYLIDSFDEFESLDVNELNYYIKAYEYVVSYLSEENIKKISVMPFFINCFSYCKDKIHIFLNKPIVNFTRYQLDLFSLGTRNLNILSQSEKEPPDLNSNNIDFVVNWYDQEQSIILGKRNSK